METVHLCRDGVLRRSVGAYDPDAKRWEMVRMPLLAWEKTADPQAFLSSMSSYVHLERDITIREIFENLSPWPELVTGLALLDFPAFLREAREVPNPSQTLTRIEIKKVISIEAVPKYKRAKRKKDSDNDLSDIFGGKPEKTGQISVFEQWDYDAYVTPDEAEKIGSKTVSLSFSPLNEWAHLPVSVSPTALLTDSTPSRHSSVFLGKRGGILRPVSGVVRSVSLPNGEVCRREADAHQFTSTFQDVILKGLLWDIGFDYSPTQRDNTANSLREQIEGIESGDMSAGMDDYDSRKRAEYEHMRGLIRAAEIEAGKLGLSVVRRSETNDDES